MTRDDDRDYYRRLDRDRDFYRDYDRRIDDSRADREYDWQQRSEASARAWKAIRDGDVVGALWNSAGPDAASQYLNATSCSPPRTVPHAIVDELSELVENVRAASGVTLAARAIDRDGDAVVDVFGGADAEMFWVKRPLLEVLRVLANIPPEAMRLMDDLAQLRP